MEEEKNLEQINLCSQGASWNKEGNYFLKNTLSYNRPIEQDALRARYDPLKALTCETTSLFGGEGLNWNRDAQRAHWNVFPQGQVPETRTTLFQEIKEGLGMIGVPVSLKLTAPGHNPLFSESKNSKLEHTHNQAQRAMMHLLTCSARASYSTIVQAPWNGAAPLRLALSTTIKPI